MCYNIRMLKLYLCKTYAEIIKKAGECAASFGKDLKKKMFAFCEDKLTMSLESEVARACGGGTFNVHVTSFSRFIHRFSREKGVVLDRESSAMAVKNILMRNAENLSCFRRSAHSPGTAVTLYELIAQLKSANVTPFDLAAGAEKLGGGLKSKIDDVVTLYNEYENYIAAEGFFDSNSYLSLMPALLEADEFKGCSAMLAGFSSLTRQGLGIVRALAKNMENVIVFALGGENTEFYTNELKESIIREKCDFSVYESNTVYGKEQRAIMKYLFDPTCFSAPKTDTDKISLYEAVDCDDEINRIASLIRAEAVKGTRYREIAVAVGNPESYRVPLTRIFSDYGIPFFLDSRRALSSHPLADLTLQYLNVLRGNFRADDVIAFEKNPYWQEDKRISDLFENFILRNALTAKHIKNGLFLTLNDKNEYGTDEEINVFETERKRMLSFAAKCGTVAEFTDAAENLLSACRVREKAEKNAETLKKYGNFADAAFTGQAYEKTLGVLFSVRRILGGAEISVNDYKNVLSSGLAACKISVIPQLSDAVYVGDYKECKYLEHKILFAAGLNGDVPFSKSDTAVLTDRDLNRLEKFNLIVEPKIRIVNRREKENVGAALLSFSDGLYLSRPAAGADGKPRAKGRIFEYFTAVFSANGRPLKVETAADAVHRADLSVEARREFSRAAYSAPRPAMREFLSGAKEYKDGLRDFLFAETTYISALRDILPDEADRAEKLLTESGSEIATELSAGSDLILGGETVSASVLESYFGCPFACFMKYGLKLGDRDEGEVRSNEFGNFLHAVLEDYAAYLKADGEKRKITDRASSDAVVNEILEKRKAEFRFARYLSAERYETLFNYVGREARRVAYAVFTQLEGSGFVPVETEAKFKDGAKYGAVKLNTSFGVKKVVGKIDRVDKCGEYVRIIDYKTGKIHDEAEDFYTGNNLQLYLYMNAFLQREGKAGGAYYFPVSDKFSGNEDENVYALKGKTLMSGDVISATGGGEEKDGSGYNSVLDVKFSSKNGELKASSSGATLDDKTFDAYLKYAVKIAERGCEEISEGVIAPSPYGDKCKYCKYSGVCGFDGTRGKARKEKNVSDKTIAEAVEEE
ncbi:MAG: PD-(D/E)XK nuclease family protein [Clostridia bacterium]|nr:PD-(D/E)XK nuclease family protein [Clostridia bacterium]